MNFMPPESTIIGGGLVYGSNTGDAMLVVGQASKLVINGRMPGHHISQPLHILFAISVAISYTQHCDFVTEIFTGGFRDRVSWLIPGFAKSVFGLDLPSLLFSQSWT